VSDILQERQKQLVQLIQRWDSDLETEILAENFYLDKSKDHRTAQVKAVLDQAGVIKDIGSIRPHNQLRGSFEIVTENATIDVFFTLSPEKNPKIQHLEVELVEPAE